jgi:hypothetical protein
MAPGRLPTDELPDCQVVGAVEVIKSSLLTETSGHRDTRAYSFEIDFPFVFQ